MDRQQALEELKHNYVELAVKLDAEQVAWDPEEGDEAKVEPTTPPADGVTPAGSARVMVHTFNLVVNAKTVADLAPIMETADSDTYMAAVGLYFNMIKAYHCVYHGVQPKDLKMKAGGKLDPSLTLSLTSADPAVVMYWEILSLPRQTLRPGEMFKSVPDDKILRQWSFAKSGGQPTTTPELNCVPLDIATKLNYFAGQQLKDFMKGKLDQFDKKGRNEFNQNEIVHISDYKKILPSMYINGTMDCNGATAKNLGHAHPEIFFNPESPPFQSLQADHSDCKDRAAKRYRKAVLEDAKNVNNYIYHKERMFWPVNSAPFSRISDRYLKGMGQMSAAIKDCATAHRQREDSPSMLLATQVTITLAAVERNMPLLVRLLEKFTYEAGVQQEVLMTKDNYWLITRPQRRLDKRRCCRTRTNNNHQFKLFDLIVDDGDEAPHVADVPLYFYRCHDKNEFLEKVGEWNGSPDNVPMAILQIGDDGSFEDFCVDDDDGAAPSDTPVWADGAVTLLPDHCKWRSRDKLREAQEILSRSGFYPKAFFMEDVLQDGRCRNDIARGLRGQQDRQQQSRRGSSGSRRSLGGVPRTSLCLDSPPPLDDDAKVVTYAMHFARPDVSRRAHEAKIEQEIKLFMEQDETVEEDTRVPVLFEKLSTRLEVPFTAAGDDTSFHSSKSIFRDDDHATAQEIFVEQSTHRKVSLLSCGPDDTRNEEQQTTVARIEYEDTKKKHGAEYALKNSGSIFQKIVLESRNPEYHLEHVIFPFLRDRFTLEAGMYVEKKDTEYPKWHRKDPDLYPECVVEAARHQQMLYVENVWKNHKQCHLIYSNWLTAFHKMESNEMNDTSPCSSIAFVGDHGVGKSFKGAAVKSLFTKNHFQQEAFTSAAAGQGVSRDTREGNLIWNDEVKKLDDQTIAVWKTLIWSGVLKRKRTVTRINEAGGQDYGEDNICNRVNSAWVICLNRAPDPKTQDADQRALNDRFIFIYGDDKEDSFGAGGVNGKLFGHNVVTVAQETQSRQNKKGKVLEIENRNRKQWNNHTNRQALVEYYLAIVGATVDLTVAYKVLDDIAKYMLTQGVKPKQKSNRFTANILKMCRALTVESAIVQTFDIPRRVRKASGEIVLEKLPMTMDNLYHVLPRLVCTDRIAAKVYLYASEGDLGINFKLKTMDALLRAVFHKAPSQVEREAIEKYKEQHSGEELNGYILHASTRIKKRPDVCPLTQNLEAAWKTMAQDHHNTSCEHNFKSDWIKIQNLQCSWGGYECLPAADDGDVRDVHGAEFTFPEITNSSEYEDARDNLPVIAVRSGDKDMRSQKMVSAEEFVVGNKQVIVYKFSWVMFLNVLEQRKATRTATNPLASSGGEDSEPIDHNSTSMAPDSVAQCFERVRMSIVDKAIQYALSDRYGARDLSAAKVEKQYRAYLLSELELDAAGGAAASGAAGNAGVARIRRRMKSKYEQTVEGVRGRKCGDVPSGTGTGHQPYAIFHKVMPPTWINGDVLDHGGTSIIPIFDDETREPTILGGGATHAFTGCVSMGDDYAVAMAEQNQYSNLPLKRNKNTEAYFRRYLDLTREGGMMDFARYRPNDEWKRKSSEKKRRAAFMKQKTRIFKEKWLADFPDGSILRFNIPMSGLAGHHPHINIVQTIKKGRQQSMGNSDNSSDFESNDSEDDSEDDSANFNNYDPDAFVQHQDDNVEGDDSDQDEDMQDNDLGTPPATDDQDEVVAADEDDSGPNEVPSLHENAPSGALNAEVASGVSCGSSGSSSSGDSSSDSGPSGSSSDSDSDDGNDDTPVAVQPVAASQNSAARAIAAIAAEPAEDTAAGHQRSRKRRKRNSAAAFFELEAVANDGDNDEMDSNAEQEEQRQLDAEMINNDDESGHSDVDEFASAAAVNRMFDERDNKRRMEQQAEREAKRRRRVELRDSLMDDEDEED
jgi:hypothetical protein